MYLYRLAILFTSEKNFVDLKPTLLFLFNGGDLSWMDKKLRLSFFGSHFTFSNSLRPRTNKTTLNQITLLLNVKDKNLDLLLIHSKISTNLNYIDVANQSLLKLLKLSPNNTEALELIYSNYF